MEFSRQYLTYEEYKALGGETLDLVPFNLLEFEARRQIDIRTFNRLKDSEEIPQEVKLCVYSLINTINSFAISKEKAGGNIASENTDGYSISYITANQISDIVKSQSEDIDYVVRTYLLGVVYNGEHLMYCGV